MFLCISDMGYEYITLKPNDLSSAIFRKKGNKIEIITKNIDLNNIELSSIESIRMIKSRRRQEKLLASLIDGGIIYKPDPTDVFILGEDRYKLRNAINLFLSNNREAIKSIISDTKSAKHRFGTIYDWIIQSTKKEEKLILLEKIQDKQSWLHEDIDEICSIIRDIIDY